MTGVIHWIRNQTLAPTQTNLVFRPILHSERHLRYVVTSVAIVLIGIE